MGGPAIDIKIEVFQGSDESLEFYFFNPPSDGSTDPVDLVPVDMTNCTARMMVRPSPDPQATMMLSLAGGLGLSSASPTGIAFGAGTINPGPAVPAYDNGFTITVTKAQSLNMNGGRAIVAHYDLMIDWNNGTTSIWMRGTFQLSASVTR